MKKLTIRADCVKIFERYGYSEKECTDLIVFAFSGIRDKQKLRLQKESYLEPNLNIIYKNGLRYNTFSKALKKYIEFTE